MDKQKFKIRILKNGPYLVSKGIKLNQMAIKTDEKGDSVGWHKEVPYAARPHDYALCRCGRSNSKPYCDGQHDLTNFSVEETASTTPYEEQAIHYEGKRVDLLDQENLCGEARFCDVGQGIWDRVILSDREEDMQEAIQEACNCPTGRLTIVKKDGTKIEPKLEQEISLVQDPANDMRGPLWVKGGITVENQDGTVYEIRNRVTLCRCGESKNMPFCDASHCECPHMKGQDQPEDDDFF